jgi:hypothetical protein
VKRNVKAPVIAEAPVEHRVVNIIGSIYYLHFNAYKSKIKKPLIQ